jgi:hypothetical protein
MNAAVGQTTALADAWREVASASATATRSITSATAAARTSVPAVGGGDRGHGRPGWLSGGGGWRRSCRGQHGSRWGAMLLAGAFEESKMQDAVFQLLYRSGMEGTDANRKKFRDIIQNSMSECGYSLDSIVEAAKTETRMFKGTPGGGLDVLPEVLRAATTEARLKGSSPEESMKALVGLAHMTKEYSPDAIKKLAPVFAFFVDGESILAHVD